VINNLFGFDDDGSDNDKDKDNSEVNFKGSDRNKENSNGKGNITKNNVLDKSTGRQANL